MKQDTTQATPFKLVYNRTAIIPIEIGVNTYSTEPITEENFQETLLRRTYELMETLENKQKRALPDKPVEFKIGDKVLLYHTKMEKQWSGKFDPKWNRSFHIEEILRNGAYKLRLDNKILIKAAHKDQLKLYHNITPSFTSNIPQLGVQRILVQPDKISQDLKPIIIINNNTSN
ncbi:hypothetical protein G9A89_007726 [Geosiphon pyriformis]|nr:hypothetical protein G9A89_007726 [Geosiphon pyriformis]